jgi:hypothetical protein
MTDSAPVTVAPIGEKFAPFWAGCHQGKLLLTRCSSCRAWAWYPPIACPSCGSDQIRWEDAGTSGQIFTYSIVHRNFLGDGANTPYVAALIVLDDAPEVRLAGVVARPAASRELIGEAVVARFIDVGEHTVPVFELRDGQGKAAAVYTRNVASVATEGNKEDRIGP